MRIALQYAPGPRVTELGPLSRAAEDAGLDGLGLASPYGFYSGAGRLIDSTKRIRVATSVLPLFHGTPFLHASSAMMLQEMSGGRFILGVGSQTKGQVRTQAGFDPEKPALRARDMVRAIRALLSGEGGYDGEYYHVTGVGSLAAGGVGVSPPPIYFSGVNPLNLRITGEVGDGMLAHPIFSRRYYDDVVWPAVEEGMRRAGRSRADFEMCAMPMIWVVDETTSREEGLRRGKRNLANYYSTRAYGGYMEFHGWARERDDIRAVWERARTSGKPIDGHAMEEIVSDAIVEEICLIGTADEVRELARERYGGVAETLFMYSLHDGYNRAGDEAEKNEQNLYRVIEAFRGFEG